MKMAFTTYKPAKTLALHELNSKTELEYKNLRKKRSSKSTTKFKESAKELVMDFARKSTIHGMGRTFQENSNKYKRTFWLLTVISALIGSIFVCKILSQRFNAGTIQTVVDNTNKPVFHIPFPEVTICNENHLNWQRLEEAKRLFMPNENNSDTLNLFELVIGLYDNLKFANFEVFNALKGKPIELVNHINFSLVFDFMTWRCEELLTNCVWRFNKINCCDAFLMSRGQSGVCWHFNTLSTEMGWQKKALDDKYPWRTGGSGPKSGLTFRVMINEEKHYRQDNNKGITVGITEPEVYHTEPFYVPANTETTVELDPVIFYFENDTRSLSSSVRKCVFYDERNSPDFKNLANFTYMIENCQVQCRQEYLLEYCNCTMDLLFPPAGYVSCRVKDLLCLAKNNVYFRFTLRPGEDKYVYNRYQGMTCKCYRNCYSLNYINNVRPTFLPEYLRGNKSYIDLDVHFRFSTMMVYRTSLVFGWVDLMVAFGGIAGLFLGCSLISGMELVYFTLVELPIFLFKELKLKFKSRNNKNQIDAKVLSHKIPSKGHNWGLNNRTIDAKNLQTNNDLYFYKNNLNTKYNAVQQWSQQYYFNN